jgi:hypothetical protein
MQLIPWWILGFEHVRRPRSPGLGRRHFYFGLRRSRGGRKIKRENDVHLRQLAKKSTYVPSFFLSFFLVRFWAFLGKGSSKTRENKMSTFQKKNHRGNIFSGGNFFLGDFFLTPFPFDFFVALVKRLSVRGTQKRDKKVLRFTGSCV